MTIFVICPDCGSIRRYDHGIKGPTICPDCLCDKMMLPAMTEETARKISIAHQKKPHKEDHRK